MTTIYHWYSNEGPQPPRGIYPCGHVFKGRKPDPDTGARDPGHGWTYNVDAVTCPGCMVWLVENELRGKETENGIYEVTVIEPGEAVELPTVDGVIAVPGDRILITEGED